MLDIPPAALHQVSGKLSSNSFQFLPFQVRWQSREFFVQQAEKRPKRVLVAAVRRRCHEDDVSGSILNQLAKQLEALLSSAADPARKRASVSFVHDDELRTSMNEVVRSSSFDEIRRHNSKGMPIENG